MEYHFVPPEERARDEKGNLLPWGYVYKEYVLTYFSIIYIVCCSVACRFAPMMSRKYH